MRRLLLVAGLALAGCAAPQAGAAAPTAKITIRAVGATMQFRTMGLSAPAFEVRAGRSRTFNRLAPGIYVVVQAPPLGVATQVGENQWTVDSSVSVKCSDGVSSNQYDLAAGQQLTCTFTSSQPAG